MWTCCAIDSAAGRRLPETRPLIAPVVADKVARVVGCRSGIVNRAVGCRAVGLELGPSASVVRRRSTASWSPSTAARSSSVSGICDEHPLQPVLGFEQLRLARGFGM